MHELPKRRSQIYEQLLISTSLPDREEAKLREDAVTDNCAKYVRKEDVIDDTDTKHQSLDYQHPHRTLQCKHKKVMRSPVRQNHYKNANIYHQKQLTAVII